MWLLWLVGKYSDGFLEFGEDFLQLGIGLLYYEGGKVLGLALLHLSGLHDVGVAVAIGIEPADKETATECLAAVARLADIEQYVRVGSEEGLDDAEDGSLQFLIVGRGTMTFVVDVELVSSRWPDGVVVHETNLEQ